MNRRVKKILHELAKLAIVFAVLGLGGLALVVSGAIPIAASSGHWPITEWFLHFSMQRSVATHSMGIEAPPLNDRSLVIKGAGHFETGCRPCHGSPGTAPPRIAQQMTPRPPDLSETVPQWEAEELFYIVKHGVKFTGMPAFPSQQRDDEVWAVIAFLRELPDMDAQQYRQLAHGEATENVEAEPLEDLLESETSPAVIETCARCHGTRGQGRGEGAFPSLAGQPPEYLQATLEAYAGGKRHSGIMAPVAAGLSQAEMQQLARYYADLNPPKYRQRDEESAEAILRGKDIAQRGIPAKNVGACSGCHGPSEIPKNPNYPIISGRYADYISLQLELFRDQNRGGSKYSHLMRSVAAGLSDEQMQDVAAYYASLEFE